MSGLFFLLNRCVTTHTCVRWKNGVMAYIAITILVLTNSLPLSDSLFLILSSCQFFLPSLSLSLSVCVSLYVSLSLSLSLSLPLSLCLSLILTRQFFSHQSMKMTQNKSWGNRNTNSLSDKSTDNFIKHRLNYDMILD